MSPRRSLPRSSIPSDRYFPRSSSKCAEIATLHFPAFDSSDERNLDEATFPEEQDERADAGSARCAAEAGRCAPGPPTHRERRGGDWCGFRSPLLAASLTVSAGYSCASEVLDYEYILSLADFVSRSSTAAKDAARALRKELKYGASDTQERAPRLMGILLQNSDTRFKRKSFPQHPSRPADPLPNHRGDCLEALPRRTRRSRRQQENSARRSRDDPASTLAPRLRLPGQYSPFSLLFVPLTQC